MKPQTSALLFCAFLFSTFGHELLNGHKVAHSARLSHANLSLSSQFQKDQCHYQCTKKSDSDDPSQHLQIFITNSVNLIAVVNATAKIGYVLDPNSSLVGLFNASSNSAIIINIQYNTGVVLSKNSIRSESFEKFLQKLTSLKKLYEQGEDHGDKFSASNIKEEISVQISEILLKLSDNHSSRIEEALDDIIDISKQFLVSLKILLPIIKNQKQVIDINIELKELVKIINGLGNFIKRLDISLLIKHQVKLDLDIIFNSKSSVDIFLYIVLQFKSKNVDLNQVLSNCFNSSESFFNLISKFAKRSNNGIDELIIIISKILAFTHNSTSISSVIIATLHYFGNLEHNKKIGEEWQTTINNLLQTINQLQLNQTLKNVVDVLQNIQNENWVENHVNISQIIKILSNSSTPVNSILRILIALKIIVPINVSLTVLLVEFVRLLTFKDRFKIIVILIPQIHIDHSNRIKLLRKILQAVDIKKADVEAFKHIPLIKTIYLQIGKFLKEIAHVEINQVLDEKTTKVVLLEIRKILIKAIRDEEQDKGNIEESGGKEGSDESNRIHLEKKGDHKKEKKHTRQKLKEKHH